jgi:hypothetical protein
MAWHRQVLFRRRAAGGNVLYTGSTSTAPQLVLATHPVECLLLSRPRTDCAATWQVPLLTSS